MPAGVHLAALALLTASLVAAAPAGAGSFDVVPRSIAESVATTGKRDFVGVLEAKLSRTPDGRGVTARFPTRTGDNGFFIRRTGRLKVQLALELRCAGGSQPIVYAVRSYTVTLSRIGEHRLRTRSLAARCDVGAKPAGDPAVRAWLCLRRGSGSLWAANEYGGAQACAAVERSLRQ